MRGRLRLRTAPGQPSAQQGLTSEPRAGLGPCSLSLGELHPDAGVLLLLGEESEGRGKRKAQSGVRNGRPWAGLRVITPFWVYYCLLPGGLESCQTSTAPLRSHFHAALISPANVNSGDSAGLGFRLNSPSRRPVCETHPVQSQQSHVGGTRPEEGTTPWRATPGPLAGLLPPRVSAGLLRRLGGALSFLSRGFLRLSRDFLGL